MRDDDQDDLQRAFYMSKQRKQLLQKHMDRLQVALCDLMVSALPKICAGSGDWWTVMVRSAKLSNWQGKQIRSGQIKSLNELDLVSLISVLRHHWLTFVDHLAIKDPQKEGIRVCDQIKGLRDTLEHLGGSQDILLDDAHAGLGAIRKLLALLRVAPNLLSDVECDWQAMGRELFSSSDAAASDPSGEDQKEVIPSTPTKDVPSAKLQNVSSTAQGIPLDFLLASGTAGKDIEEKLANTTYVGIDFGTSTTVASRVVFNPHNGRLETEPIPIQQEDRLGRTISDHIVPSCLAWTNNRLLVGRGAADLKSELTIGIDLWFSFKMELGIDLGPKYYNSLLNGVTTPLEIRRPQDAAAAFFNYLREGIEAWVKQQGLPSSICYAVSVPASFEANQRTDLCNVLQKAGIQVNDHGIIDEPNAAFISFILDSLKSGTAALDIFRQRPIKVLVFDFGAGTCDLSVLEVGVKDNRLVSTNLAISQFQALGGDNIDRQIAEKFLWPQMQRNSSTKEQFRSSELQQAILPKLSGAAEQLKIQSCKFIDSHWNGVDSGQFSKSEQRIKTSPIDAFSIRGFKLALQEPQLSLSEFYDAMGPFLASPIVANDGTEHAGGIVSILEPIQSALRKAKLSVDDLNMVLFIGGSCQNPLVREAVTKYFGRFVECVVGQDIRTPVSRGAAFHSFAWHGLQVQLIRPITSEPVYVITKGKVLHQILPAGTPMPSDEVTFCDGLVVQRDGQEKIELPVCVSNERKLLGMLEIRSPLGRGFTKGDPITLVCRVDENKLLKVDAKAGTAVAGVTLLNPLANTELTHEQTRRLMARQALNESIVAGNGRPKTEVLRRFAEACGEASCHLESAEAYEALERLSDDEKTSGNATSICYHYSKAGMESLSDHWAEVAYKRKPTWTSAFNLAISKSNAAQTVEAHKYFEEALELSPGNPIISSQYGIHLHNSGQGERADKLLNQAIDSFQQQLNRGQLASKDVFRVRAVASLLRRNDILADLDAWEAESRKRNHLYTEINLAVSTKVSNLTEN